MTRMSRLGVMSVCWLVLAGCTVGPVGPRATYTTIPPARTGQPMSPPPIATQPVLIPAGTASAVRVLPNAALPRHAMVQMQHGFQNGTASLFQSSVRPLAVLASSGQFVDGRPVPVIDPNARIPRSGGALPRRTLATADISDFPSASSRVPDLPATPQEDLKYRGGRTIRDLKYVNLYVGGQESWDPQDWKNIDRALAAAMSDAHLNNVIVQYFGNKPISSTFVRSYFLSGWRPQFVAKVDLERQIRSLHSSGALNGFDLPNTCFNFYLPRGTVLGDPNGGESKTLESKAIPQEEAEDSTGGLGGYHGSIHIGSATVYYSTEVYSEQMPNGTTNGIPVFDENWKNVVATAYHELQEFRTDPDVDDAIRDGTTAGTRFLGWTSDSGLEIGDYPIFEAKQLRQVFVEVPLADGSGTVPVQLQYSNAVHGPEGPIPYPHGMEPSPGTPPVNPNPQPNPQPNPGPTTPPVTTDPELAKVIAQWNQLEDFVKKAIVRLAGGM